MNDVHAHLLAIAVMRARITEVICAAAIMFFLGLCAAQQI